MQSTRASAVITELSEVNRALVTIVLIHSTPERQSEFQQNMFDTAAIKFLRDLKENNDREWFQPRKERYETLVREPMLKAVEAVNRKFASVAPDYITDPSKAVYRIYRDTRFSPNKTPYKTHIGALLWHKRLGKNGGAVFYFHLSPEELLIAGGLYHAPPTELVKFRTHIAEHHERLTKILQSRSVREKFGGLQGDKLSRPPKGYSADHPAIEYLKHKDLLLETTLPPRTACEKSAISTVTSHLNAMAPFVEFLNEPALSQARRSRDPLLMGA